MTDASASAPAADATVPEQDKPVPTLTIQRGNPTDVEVAALTVLAAAMGGGRDSTARPTRTGWTSGSRRLTPTAVRGTGWGRG